MPFKCEYVGPLPPRRISKKEQDRLWQTFYDGPGTTHSGNATLLSILINRAEEEKVPYRLTAYPGRTYHMERIRTVLFTKEMDK